MPSVTTLKRIGDAICDKDYLNFVPTSDSIKPPHIANQLFRLCSGETCRIEDVFKWASNESKEGVISSEDIITMYSSALDKGENESVENIRTFRFLLNGIALPLLKISPERQLYIGTLQAGKKYEYKYELIPTDPPQKISLELIHPKFPTGADIKLEKQVDKYLLTVTITPQKDQKSISLNFAVKIKEPKDWADIKFTLNGRIQSSQLTQPKPEKTTP